MMEEDVVNIENVKDNKERNELVDVMKKDNVMRMNDDEVGKDEMRGKVYKWKKK
jgi:hypothetical protein